MSTITTEPEDVTEPAATTGDDRYERRGPRTFRGTVLGRFSTIGLAVGLVCWHASLVPTLLPRSWPAQAAISALSFLVGYGVGVLVALVVRMVMRRTERHGPSDRLRHRARRVLAVAAVAVVVLGLAQWQSWQDGQRHLLGMEHLSPISVAPMVVVSVALAALLLGIGRAISFVVSRIDQALTRHIPGWIAHTATVVIVVVVTWTFSTDYVGDRLVDWANTQFGEVDTTTAEGVVQPTTDTVSGGPGTLTAWDTLGMEGRNFAAGATTEEELRRFAGRDATVEEPVRVYVGLRTADTPEARAELAVRELERTGGFEREVLAVWTVTGTGWVDPVSARSLETMWGGDTAIVATQYSYLPSWISFLVDKDKAGDAATTLFDAVYDAWSELPEDDRPQLIAYGLSLGSYGSEEAFEEGSAAASVERVADRTDGVLWMGPTNSNSIWNQIEASREPGSPAWQPVFDDGRVVRYAPDPEELDGRGEWGPPRVLYIAHPSDPVTWWNMRTMWSRPPWMDHPVGDDVPGTVRWFPVVTWIQVVNDLIAGFSAPPGHGHNYDPDVTDGWAAVVPPPGWTADDTARLEEIVVPS